MRCGMSAKKKKKTLYQASHTFNYYREWQDRKNFTVCQTSSLESAVKAFVRGGFDCFDLCHFQVSGSAAAEKRQDSGAAKST